MTPEKILELLPEKQRCSNEPESSLLELLETCQRCPYVHACQIKIHNDTIDKFANALAGKVVAKEDLLTVEEIWKIILDNINENSYSIMAEAIFQAQQRKANREKV
jgi:hypothetical protein